MLQNTLFPLLNCLAGLFPEGPVAASIDGSRAANPVSGLRYSAAPICTSMNTRDAREAP